MEIWKDIPGKEGRYQASNLGHIRSLPRVEHRRHGHGGTAEWRYKGKMLSIRPKGCGHLNVTIDGRTYLVHRLVLTTFVGPPGPGQECLHIDGNPVNNCVENLRWGTRFENKADERRHAEMYRRRIGVSWLSTETIRAIKRDLNTKQYTQGELAVKYGVHKNTINNINRGFTHKWIDA